MALLLTARAASFTASLIVGCAWIVRARSSALPPYSMCVTISLMSFRHRLTVDRVFERSFDYLDLGNSIRPYGFSKRAARESGAQDDIPRRGRAGGCRAGLDCFSLVSADGGERLLRPDFGIHASAGRGAFLPRHPTEAGIAG